ncbi:MICOS complex subunit MIC60 isoform X1 [Petromyzon marinus]|uniref:MICOS complex subunit MIC60 n=1 Tax=Petromyzon marinus TaxID=7757 RepID=A0AAJ7SVA0_PETMA|nr:MICOS complex subunit MIC60 isoform X1 [Petromyzon marinus]
MWRSCRRAGTLIQKCLCGRTPCPSTHAKRCYSAGIPGSGPSAAGKVVGGGLLVVVGGLGGTVLYASWDPRFRSSLEQNVPYADKLLGAVLGPSVPFLPMPSKKPGAGDLNPIAPIKKKHTDERAATATAQAPVKQEDRSSEASVILSSIGEAPSMPAPGVTNAATGPKPGHEGAGASGHDGGGAAHKEHECESCKHEPSGDAPPAAPPRDLLEAGPAGGSSKEVMSQDTDPEAEVAALSKNLEEAVARSGLVTAQAVGAQDAATAAIGTYISCLRHAMEDEAMSPEEKTEQWQSVREALAARDRAVHEASQAQRVAQEEVVKLQGLVEEARGTAAPAAAPRLQAAGSSVRRMLSELQGGSSRVEAAQTEARLVSQYQEMAERAKEEFRQELESIVPGWQGRGDLNKEELNALLLHAHRRTEQLRRELAERQALEEHRLVLAREQQRTVDQRGLEEALATALHQQRQELVVAQQRKIEELKDAMEMEMRTQLRRATAAHSDHLQEALKLQAFELGNSHKKELTDKMVEQDLMFRREILDQRDSFTQDINKAFAQVHGIRNAVDGLAEREEIAKKAHSLWLAGEALRTALAEAGPDGPDGPCVPLAKHVDAARAVLAESEFAQVVTGAVPSESRERGVYSLEALRHRFRSVRRLARRVALIDETRNSLYQYFLSYVQAALMLEPATLKPPAEGVAVEELGDAFRVLAYAAFCLEHGDLEQAARFVTALRGEARRVADSWLHEARLTLETRQAIALLTAHASAVGLAATHAQP